MLCYDKGIGSLKMWITQERGEGKLTKKVTKSDVRERFPAKKCAHKKIEIFGVTLFFNNPYDDFLLWCIFMDVLVDDVISYL